jgi:hypothetical protein
MLKMDQTVHLEVHQQTLVTMVVVLVELVENLDHLVVVPL